MRTWTDAKSLEDVLSLGNSRYSPKEAEELVQRAWNGKLSGVEVTDLPTITVSGSNSIYEITPKHLTTMRPTEWAVDDLVDGFLWLIQAQLPDIAVLPWAFCDLLTNPSSYSNTTNRWTSYPENNKSQPPSSKPHVRKWEGKQILDRYRGILINMNLKTRTHWQVVYLDVESLICYFFCSMNKPLPVDEFKLLEERLALDFQNRKPFKLTWVKVVVPEQDADDCGARVGIHAVIAATARHVSGVLWEKMTHPGLGIMARKYLTWSILMNEVRLFRAPEALANRREDREELSGDATGEDRANRRDGLGSDRRDPVMEGCRGEEGATGDATESESGGDGNDDDSMGNGSGEEGATLLQQFRAALKAQFPNSSNREVATWFHAKILKSKKKLDWKSPLKDHWANVVKALDDPSKEDELRSFSEKEQRAVVALCRSGNAVTQPSTSQVDNRGKKRPLQPQQQQQQQQQQRGGCSAQQGSLQCVLNNEVEKNAGPKKQKEGSSSGSLLGVLSTRPVVALSNDASLSNNRTSVNPFSLKAGKKRKAERRPVIQGETGKA